MAKDSTNPEEKEAPAAIDQQAREQTGQRQVRVRVDEKDMETTYSNAFRTNTSAEEVILDFGFNQLLPTRQEAADKDPRAVVGEIVFEVNSRVITNFYTAKRLAITLSQIVRRHEQQFGELKLNAAERATKPAK